jgi:hypothetical protein
MSAHKQFGLGKARRGLLAGVAALLAGLALTASASAEGNFVIGDQNAAVGTQVTFWGAKWWKLNSLSGGPAPAAFKGFANTLATPLACGSSWSTDPGNSSDPPAGPLPGLIDVIVSSAVNKSGRIISGDVHEVVLVRTDPGYAANPGHAGTGTVVGVVCNPAKEQEEKELKEKEEEEEEEEIIT